MRQTSAILPVFLVGVICLARAVAADESQAGLSMCLVTEGKPAFTCYDSVKGEEVEVKVLQVYPAQGYDVFLRMYGASSQRFSFSDHVVWTFRELFSGETVEHRQPIPWPWWREIPCAQIDLHVTPENVSLKPGFYHVRGDLYQSGRLMTKTRPGSTFFYLADSDESLRYITASYALGYFSFLIDPETNAVIQSYPSPAAIPPMLDPFDPQTRDEWQIAHQCYADPKGTRQFLRRQKGVGELVGDCGIGMVFAWYAYHVMGETDRARYTHELFDRAICGRLLKYDLVWGTDYTYIHMYFQVARSISYACILFHDDPEYGKWARDTFRDLAVWMGEKYPVVKLSHKCVPAEEGVYTGRVFSSKVFFKIAQCLYPDAPFSSPVDSVGDLVDYAVSEADYILKHGGHYHEPATAAYLKKCGNINMAGGMVGAWHLARRMGRDKDADLVARALHGLFEAITPLDTRPGGWMVGDAVTVCTMALRILGDDPVVEAYRRDSVPDGDHTPKAQQRYSKVGSWILNSREWKNAVRTGKDWRLLVDLPGLAKKDAAE